jgi:hypothetical protein
MENTALRPDWSDNPRIRAKRGELMTYAGKEPRGALDLYIQWYPAGSAISTLPDFIKFAQALLPDSRGGTLLFDKPETLSEFYEPSNYYSGGTPRSLHGLWTLPHLTGHVAGHGGNTAGCSSMLLISLDEGFGAVVMTNQSGEAIYNFGLIEKIFGTSKIAKDDGWQTTAPISGVFKNARGYEKGIQKVLGIINYYPVSQASDGSISIPLVGDSLSIEQVDPEIYLFGMNGLRLFAYAVSDTDGKVQSFDFFVMDLQRASMAEFIISYLSAILLIVALIYSLAYMAVALIRRIRKRKSPCSGWRLILCSSIILAAVNLVLFIVSAMIYAATLTTAAIQGILFIFLALVPVIYAAALAVKTKKLTLTGKQKAGLIINGVMGLIVTFNVLYWQLWMFWVF